MGERKKAPGGSGSLFVKEIIDGYLVAGYGFSLFAWRWSDVNRLIRVSEVGRSGLLDVSECADLHHRRLRLFQNQFFVDGADFGLFFISLLAPCAIFFGGRQWHVVLEVAYAS